MKHREYKLLPCLWAVVITIGLFSEDGFAQISGLGEQAKSSEKELSLEEKIQNYKVDIEVSRPVKITEFLKEVEEQVPTPLNILVSRNARSVLIPEMVLTNVSVEAVLSAAVLAAENEVTWNFDSEEVIVINRDEGYFDDSQETVTVVNAKDILANTEEASLLSAIEIGLEMRDSSKKNVSIKLHEETKLLFIKGTDSDINIVMQVVAELGGKPWPPKGQAGGGGGFVGGPGGGGFGGGGQGGGAQGGGGQGGGFGGSGGGAGGVF